MAHRVAMVMVVVDVVVRVITIRLHTRYLPPTW